MITLTPEKLDAYATAKGSQAADHEQPGHDKDCMVCAHWATVQKSDRVCTLSMAMAQAVVSRMIQRSAVDCMELARDFMVIYSLGLSAGIELTEADELAKLEALNGQ